MLDFNRDNKLPRLVKKVKALSFYKVKDIRTVKYLLNAIYDELSILKNKRSRIVYKNSKNSKAYAKYEAEEALIVGLLFVLQEKSIEYISRFHGN